MGLGMLQQRKDGAHSGREQWITKALIQERRALSRSNAVVESSLMRGNMGGRFIVLFGIEACKV